MFAVAERFISEEEYLQLEATSPVKHEYFNGRIYAMAGASPTHCQISFNLAVAIGSRLRGQNCRGVGSDQRVKIAATGLMTYPDVLIVCPPEQYDESDPNSLINPQVILEVLSPSTERYDRTDKFDQYRQIPSLTDYILVAQERVRVEHYHRTGDQQWTVVNYHQREQTITLPELNLELPMEEIYDRLQLPTGIFLLPEGGNEQHNSQYTGQENQTN